jgi:hypothetical protein
MWLLLMNRAPTWENLQKKSFVGPSRCALCKQENETSQHLFLQCPSLMVWNELRNSLGTTARWEGDSVEQALQSWISSSDTTPIKSLPLISAWGIWLARNHAIFDDLEPSSSLLCYIFPVYPGILPSILSPPPSKIPSPYSPIDPSLPWDFFDGVAQGSPSFGAGGNSTLR